MSTATKDEWTEGWPVAISAAIGIGLGMGTVAYYTLGVFAISLSRPLEEGGLGLTPEQVMLAFPIYTGGVLLFGPLAGVLADRWGARRVVLSSIVLFSLTFMTLSLNPGYEWLYAATWIAISLFGAGTLPITFTRVVSSWFSKNRGLALGVAMVATGLCGGLAKIFALQVISIVGWRLGYVIVGMLPLVIALPVCLVALRDPSDVRASTSIFNRAKPALILIAAFGAGLLAVSAFAFAYPQIERHGLRIELVASIAFGGVFLALVLLLFFARARDGAVTGGDRATATVAGLSGLSKFQSLRQWRFWLLLVIFTTIGFVIGGALPNIELMLTSKGFAADEAVGLAALVGVAIIAGRLLGGFVIDRWWPPGVTFVISAIPSVALFMLAGDVTHLSATGAILLVGFGAGVEFDFLAFLVARYFGLRSYALVYGILFGAFSAGVGIGAFAYSAAIQQQSLSGFLQASGISLIVASALVLLIGKAPRFADIDSAAPAPQPIH